MGAYVAAFSSDASGPSGGLPSRIRGLVLHYDEWPINELRKSVLNSVESLEPDSLSNGPRLATDPVPSDNNSQTLRAIRSALLITMAANGRLHGLVSLGQRLSDLPYAREDKRLLLVVASQMGSFIENMDLLCRMIEEERTARELQMAADVQRHLFPTDGLGDNSRELYGPSLPALSAGGDYYDT